MLPASLLCGHIHSSKSHSNRPYFANFHLKSQKYMCMRQAQAASYISLIHISY